MRLTSSIAACLAGFAVTAMIVVAVHGKQPSRVATSSIFLVPAAGHQHTDTLALASSPPAAGIHTGTKPKAAPQYAAPTYRAPGSIVIGSYQQSLINRDRASVGLGPLTWSSCLASVARANAVRLSRQGWGQPYPTTRAFPDLGCRLGYQ